MKGLHVMRVVALAASAMASAGTAVAELGDAMRRAGPALASVAADRAEWVRAAKGTPWSQWGAWASTRARRRKWKAVRS